ncbi:ribokinase [Advenella mimigardefordensis]|uniref:Ribokinase n=1 Tax=Advenella mimigardefordensis (strain DSM 17166 / LMG 22922 / DPN7) TaxID=1247726 RepID=W0PJ36_ADVMD|nr:ribokinase [Advenella mimigardefordensis]AHG66027.1 ribokinase [Advenella mimigardefordensis DPN7]
MSLSHPRIVIVGIYVADLLFKASRMPVIGETLLGSHFAMGPGGKGSNQAVAAARAGAEVIFYTRLGNDAFAANAQKTWQQAGVTSRATLHDDLTTGAAHIFVEDESGRNAIIVYPGAAAHMVPADLDLIEQDIASADIFVTQLEQPLDVALHGLRLARKHGVTTIFNPAPATQLPDELFPLCDWITPNETEASLLTGLPVGNLEQARAAAGRLLAKGVTNVVITLGEQGCLLHTASDSIHIPAYQAGKCIDTAGAGDGFTAGLATALAEGQPPEAALRFASALAGISVTRSGTAASMPERGQIDTLLSTSA